MERTQKVDTINIGLLKRISCVYLEFVTKIVRGRPRPFHHHFNTKIQYRIKMASSEETNKYKDKVDERPIRVDHSLMGRRESEGSSVDGVSHEDIAEFLGDLKVLKNIHFAFY